MNRALIIAGILIVAVGIFWPYILQGLKIIWSLLGNIVIRRGGFSFYFPLTLCIIVSALLTLFFALLRK